MQRTWLVTYTMFLSEDIGHQKLPLSCKVVQKCGFLGTRFVGERNTPDIGHAFSDYTYFRPCGRIWLSFVSELGDQTAKGRKEGTVAKYKSADVGRSM